MKNMATTEKRWKPLGNRYVCFDNGINQFLKAFLKTKLGINPDVFISSAMTFSSAL
jgi:hypothetical protein